MQNKILVISEVAASNMATFKEALAELQNNGVAVFHHGTPTSKPYVVVDGQSF